MKEMEYVASVGGRDTGIGHPAAAASLVTGGAPRSVSIGLSLVVVSLALFSVVAAYQTSYRIELAERSAGRLAAFQHASDEIRQLGNQELRYLVNPSRDRLAALDAAGTALSSALDALAAEDDLAGAHIESEMHGLLERYREVAAELTYALESGDRAQATKLAEDKADPIFNAMFARLTAATQDRAAQAEDDLQTLRKRANAIILLSPVVFAVGSILLIALWRILGRFQRVAQETYRRIDRLSQRRRRFVEIVGHEFRTPLTGIQGFSELMRDEPLTPEEVREYAGDINKDARGLARLIGDMIDLDRMESGQMTLEAAPIDLNRIVSETAASLQSEPSHALTLHLDEAAPVVVGARDRLTQVASNLLGNAIRFSPAGEPVEVTTKCEGATVMLTVRDHGAGIPADRLETIFDRYDGVETTLTRGTDGSGWGLPLVREIVRLHGGRIWAKSEVGVGSAFTVELPLARPAPTS